MPKIANANPGGIDFFLGEVMAEIHTFLALEVEISIEIYGNLLKNNNLSGECPIIGHV
jgi:hypothetical protein